MIHDFGVPGFLEKMDVIPGPKEDDNEFSVTPIVEGTYKRQVLRAVRRLPLAHAVQRQDREPRPTTRPTCSTLQAQGNVSDQPLLGGITSQTQAGLEGGSRMTATTPSTSATRGAPAPRAR